MGPPFEPKIGDLVIIKGGIVARILPLESTGRWGRPYDGGDQRRGRAYVSADGAVFAQGVDLKSRCRLRTERDPGRDWTRHAQWINCVMSVSA